MLQLYMWYIGQILYFYYSILYLYLSQHCHVSKHTKNLGLVRKKYKHTWY